MGFLTFDSTLHFYNLKPGLTQPQSLVVSELDEPFLPLPDDMLVNLSESRQVSSAGAGGCGGLLSWCWWLWQAVVHAAAGVYGPLMPLAMPWKEAKASHPMYLFWM